MRTLLFLLCVFGALPAWASGWTSNLAPRTHLPLEFMVVDKDLQKAILVRTSSDGKKIFKYREMPCTTGMKTGDKQLENDQKTPEGVYFLERKVTSGLDYNRFGNSAYPLNYPNPIDRIQGKTGNGILIHGRGRIFGPRQTLGCIVLENDEVDGLDKHIQVSSTPVIVGERIAWNQNAAIPHEVLLGTWAWARTRDKGDDAFFNLYDAKLYEKSSGLSFARFKEQTRREIAKGDWADVRIGKVQIVDGPGYVVSVFSQLAMQDNVRQEGWRRLYWMKRGSSWKVVGEEWVPKSLTGTSDYSKGVEREILAFLKSASAAWEHRNEEALINLYSSTAKRGQDRGRNAIWQTLRREIASREANPYQGATTVAITPKGVEAHIASLSGSRTLVFRPGNFDTWTIVEED